MRGVFDGLAALWSVIHSNMEQFEPFPAVYYNAPPDVSGRDVVLVDFSYKLPVILEMAKQAKSILIIDHHDSTFKELGTVVLPSNVRLIFDTYHSGAGLSWKYYHPNKPIPQFIFHIEDRDLWRFRDHRSIDFHSGLIATGILNKEVDAVITLLNNIYKDEFTEHHPYITCLYKDGNIINRFKNIEIETMIKAGKRYGIVGGYKVPIANIFHGDASVAGNIMAKGELFSVCYSDEPLMRRYDLRSVSDGLDVSLIAKEYGGGGHVHSSGFKIPYDHPLIVSNHGMIPLINS